jgi:hypothetical protein
LGDEGSNDHESQPFAGDAFNGIGPQRATLELFSHSELAAREESHDRNSERANDETWE